MNENQQSGTRDDYHCGRWNDTLDSFPPVGRVITSRDLWRKHGERKAIGDKCENYSDNRSPGLS